MKIKLRVEITYVKIVESVDGEINEQPVKSPMTTSSAWTITKGNVKSVLDEFIDELTTKSETLETVDRDGKPIGSGWAIKLFDKLAIDLFETKPMRVFSFSPTPEKYSNPKC